MTLFSDDYVTLKIFDDFKVIPNKGDFVELSLVNPKIPMTVKFSIIPTSSGLTDFRNEMESNINNNTNITIISSDFIAVNEDVYYMLISVINNGETELRRNEFMYIRDDNLYSFEFVYPYADAELDDFYLNIIRSMKIKKPKYILSDTSYVLNDG